MISFVQYCYHWYNGGTDAMLIVGSVRAGAGVDDGLIYFSGISRCIYQHGNSCS